MPRRLMCLVTLCLLSLSVTLIAQGRAKPRKPVKNPPRPEIKGGIPPIMPGFGAPAGVPANLVVPGDLDFHMTVNSDLTLNQTEQALCDNMATTIGGYATVPQDRLDFFSGVGGVTLVYWAGLVNDVTPIAGGYRVTVAVGPGLVDESSGMPVTVDGDYSELFDVIGGVVTYVGSLDPNNEAGTGLIAFVD